MWMITYGGRGLIFQPPLGTRGPLIALGTLGSHGRASLLRWREQVGLSSPVQAQHTATVKLDLPPTFLHSIYMLPTAGSLSSLPDPPLCPPCTPLLSPCLRCPILLWCWAGRAHSSFVQQALNGHLLCCKQSTAVLERNKICLTPSWIVSCKGQYLNHL